MGAESCGKRDTPAVGQEIELRTDLRPGDIGTIVHLHGVIYAREYGFDL